MVKKYLACLNCDSIYDIKTCSMCNHHFCRKCVESQNIKLEENIDSFYINYCAFNCSGSRGRKYCDTCGIDYLHMTKCLYCDGIFCYHCRIKNFEREVERGDKIEDNYHTSLSDYCSNMCYVTFKENTNEEIRHCKKCPTSFLDLKNIDSCELCRNKERFKKIEESHNLRKELKNILNKICEMGYSYDVIEKQCQKNFEDYISKEYKFVSPDIVKFKNWYEIKDGGIALIFIIWDTVILNYIRNLNMELNYIL